MTDEKLMLKIQQMQLDIKRLEKKASAKSVSVEKKHNPLALKSLKKEVHSALESAKVEFEKQTALIIQSEIKKHLKKHSADSEMGINTKIEKRISFLFDSVKSDIIDSFDEKIKDSIKKNIDVNFISKLYRNR